MRGGTRHSPTLPSDTSPAAVAALLTGPDGTRFLGQISSFQWSDAGREASGLFDWIATDAHSSDPETAARAGVSAHALAEYLAGQPAGSTTNVNNAALLTGYAKALSPFQSTMIGDSRRTSEFQPLDNLESGLPRTARVFSAIVSASDARKHFAGAAESLAETYEGKFTEFAAANPTLPDGRIERSYVLWSARLRGLLARSITLADSVDKASGSAGATTQLRFAIVSRMVHGSDPRISPQYFTDEGTLIDPAKLQGGLLSLYSAQLVNYLSTYPRLADAVAEFDQTLNLIASG